MCMNFGVGVNIVGVTFRLVITMVTVVLFASGNSV